MERLRKVWRGRTMTFGVPLLTAHLNEKNPVPLFFKGSRVKEIIIQRQILEDLPIKDDMNAEKYVKFFSGVITFLRSIVAKLLKKEKVVFRKYSLTTPGDLLFKQLQLLYLVGGSFGLREFAQIRYDVHKLHGKVDPALKEKLKQNTVTLESEYEKLEKSDLDNWENIRGPRLWEDSRTVQKQRREALRLKTE